MLNIEIEKLGDGWLVTVAKDGEQVVREFITDPEKAQAVVWTAIVEEF